ncbi:MAG: class I SAM-dependent methyltransferase [Candidatus Omnitrophota bacterium]|jgi:ubiquinone/menaquinone biosynthesis C-methylase UbiE
MKSLFDRYYKKYDSWYDKNKFAYLSELKAIKNILPKKAKILEIGVGTGRFAAPLKIGYGVDPSKKMLRFARKRGIKTKLGFGEKLPFGSSFFDCVVIIITICFVNDPALVLREARRVLNKNGKIIIGIIDKESFLGDFYKRKKSVFYRQAHFFSVKEISGLLRDAGFKRLSYSQTLFSMPEDIISIEKPLRGFGKGGFVIVRGRAK